MSRAMPESTVGQGRLLVAAGMVDQRHGGVPFSLAPAAGLRGGGLAAGGGGAEPVGAGAGGDDVGVVGEPVDDRGAEPRVGEGLGPLAERGVGRDRDGGLLLSLGEDLEQQLGAAPVQLDVAELIEAEQVDPPVAGDHLGEHAVVGGLGELVDQGGGGDVADPVALLGRRGAQPDQQVRLPRAGVADQAQRLPGGDPLAAGQRRDQRRGNVGVRGEVEVLQPLRPGEPGLADEPGPAPRLPVIALQRQQLGEEPLVAGLLAQRDPGDLAVAVPDRGQPQDRAGPLDRRVHRRLGQLVPARAHDALPSSGCGASRSSWS